MDHTAHTVCAGLWNYYCCWQVVREPLLEIGGDVAAAGVYIYD